MFWRPILLVNGILLSILGGTMLVAMVADLVVGNPDWKVFATSSLMTTFVGMGLYLNNRGYHTMLKTRQAFLLTTTSYLSLSFFASLPFQLMKDSLSLVDAYFEAASGITSSGATVMSGLDFLPPGILLWRSLLNALGGIGIVVLALAILPMLRIGGMQLFRTESSDKTEKILPKTPQIAMTISIIFTVLMLTCAWCYWLAGMSGFDAICHAMTTVSTGGFSTHDRSMAYFESFTIEMISVVFMLSGAIPLMVYYKLAGGNFRALTQDSQIQMFLSVIMIVVTALIFWLMLEREEDFIPSLRYALFTTVAIITTTGYGTTDYASWGGFSTTLLFMLIVVGGCTGSTSGGIKIFRYQILYKTARAQLQQLVQPHGVFIPRYEGKQVGDNVIASVMTFFMLFAFCFMVIAVALSAFGLNFITAMSSAAQALANVGPGLGAVVGPTGNYSTLAEGAKWILSFAMIMGRLELFTVIVLFTPIFWRR